MLLIDAVSCNSAASRTTASNHVATVALPCDHMQSNGVSVSDDKSCWRRCWNRAHAHQLLNAFFGIKLKVNGLMSREFHQPNTETFYK